MSQRKRQSLGSLDEDYIAHHQDFKKQKRKYVCSGPWTLQENQIYLKFIKTNKRFFVDEYVKRGVRPFTKLSKKLKKRTPEQCRSHFQKFEVKNDNDIDSIISRLQAKVEELREKNGKKEATRDKSMQKKTAKTKEPLGEIAPFVKNQEYEIYISTELDFSIKLAWSEIEQV